MLSWSVIDDSRNIIDNPISIIDDCRVKLQLVASFTIVTFLEHSQILNLPENLAQGLTLLYNYNNKTCCLNEIEFLSNLFISK